MIALVLLTLAQEKAPAAAQQAGAWKLSSEVGYRAVLGETGSASTYRSVVNLGEGPRLLHFESTYDQPAKFLDHFRLNGANWGDPLNTLAASAEKSGRYRVDFTYRNLAYFNALPSFASPQLARLGPDARTTNQNALDTRQRFWNLDLDLLPGRRWQPFVGVAHTGGLGTAVSPFVLDENSYPAASRVDHGYTVVRGGVRLEWEQLHLRLEQGGATFHDDTSLRVNDPNTGNREGPYFGRPLLVRQAERLYDVRGTHQYSSAGLTYSPLSWVDVTGEFYFSQPRSEVRVNESAQGTLLWLDALRLVNGQQSLATGYANQPRTAGGFTLELRPVQRLRILQSWQTDRTHQAGSLALLTSLDGRALPPVNASDRLLWRQNEQRLQAFYELHPRLTLFGGHRYLWGDAEVRRASIAPGAPLETGALRRHSALGGIVWRPLTKLTVNGESEVGRGERTYFRTSLQDFEQLRLRVRYQFSPAWQIHSRLARLANRNPSAGVDLNFRSQQANLTLQWTRKTLSLMADYTRSAVFSDLGFFDPATYRQDRSRYRDNAHAGTLAADWNLPRQMTLTLGGSLFRSAGSRPSRYYQPLLRWRVPVSPHGSLFAEWRQISLGQSLFAYEAFGSRQFTAGFRIAR